MNVSRKKPSPQLPPHPGKENDSKSCAIVAVGASAGGLDAFLHLFGALPVETGLAYVVIQHMDPSKDSLLADILARSIRIPIVEVKDGMPVHPDRIHVIPPNTNMGIANGRLTLIPRPERREPHLPVDFFFRSLAQDCRDRAIGVILSGNGSDGSQGMRAIKAEGGITFAEDEKSAKYPGMPASAVATGCVDFVLPPERIARELVRIARHPYVAHPGVAPAREKAGEADEDAAQIFLLVRDAAGVDFSQYKPSTTMRRILRRMALLKIEDLRGYGRHLQEHPEELEALYQDFLINVTSFFRDPWVFETLKATVIPRLLENRAQSDVLRVWAPACSTGEEAYSVAIVLLEAMKSREVTIPFQIFATDINDAALETARAGTYRDGIAQDVSPERLRRFFEKTDRGYQIGKIIRESCIFARQNLAKDPPFSRLDLVSCRNTLIYMKPVLHKKILAAFHYALKPGGFLVLGTSETIGEMTDLFGAADRKCRIYVRKAGIHRPALDFGLPPRAHDTQADRRRGDPAPSLEGLLKEADGIVLSRYSLPGVVVNEKLDILQFRGDTAPYLAPAPGTASLNLARMAREGLLPDLRMAIRKARASNAPVRKEGARVVANGGHREITLHVVPIRLPTTKDTEYLVLLEEVPRPADEGRHDGRASGKARKLSKEREQYIAQIENDLATAKEFLQTVSEEYEATNEELRAANEEIQSSNEELQSTNEELETSKEELQSTNEELVTVNEALGNRNTELAQVNNDLGNLLASVNAALVMVGEDLRIRRFTSAAERVFNLIPADIGRPIEDIRPAIPLNDLGRKIRSVIDSLSTMEEEVSSQDGRVHLVRLRPYRTEENRIDGAVIALFDVTATKSAVLFQEKARLEREIFDTIREPLLVLDGAFFVLYANRSFYRVFRTKPGETENRLLFELGDGQWNIPSLRELLVKVLPKKTEFRDFRVTQKFPGIGRKTMLLNARRIAGGNPGKDMILLAIEEAGGRGKETGRP